MKSKLRKYTNGIYCIRHFATDRCYIGSSKHIEYRWQEHVRLLRKGAHYNDFLQRTWNKYGEEGFSFHILEENNLSEDALLEREQEFIDKLNPQFNIGETGGGDNLTSHPKRTEIIEKMRAAAKRNGKRIGELFKKKYRGAGNPNFGNKWSDEQKKIQSDKLKGKPGYRMGKSFEELFGEEKALLLKMKLSSAAKSKIGTLNPFFGRKHSAESKEKMSKARKGVTPSNVCRIQIDGVTFESMHEASKILGIPIPTISWRIKSTNPKFSGYIKLQ